MEALVQSHKEPSLEDFLRAKFRMDQFRPLQRPVIEAALLGRDCFVKFGGGVGKSLCFQFLSLYRDDTFTVVVSPLVSLMCDANCSASLSFIFPPNSSASLSFIFPPDNGIPILSLLPQRKPGEPGKRCFR